MMEKCFRKKHNQDECATAISEFHAMRYDHAKNLRHPNPMFS